MTGKKTCAIWPTKTAIAIYALTTEQDIDSETPLYHAPFFNTYEDGRVCMGNVKLNIQKNCGLEDFIAYWQSGFFNSYFSHMMQGHYPVKGNMVQLWKSLSGTKKQFPEKVLIPLNRTVKHLIQ
jgi:PRTRC genetic system protein B